jgi:hypothetical protein
MPEVFYGQVFLKKRSAYEDSVVINGISFGKAAGTYNIQSDVVNMFADDLKDWISSQSQILVHELAHRYYFKFLNSADRRRWEDFFERLKTQSASTYGDSNPEEDFAEAILHYVFEKGVMKRRDVRDRVEALLNRTYRENKNLIQIEG